MDERIATTRLREDLDERFNPLRRQLGVTSFGINQMLLEPGQRSRIHRHRQQEEVYLVLEGALTLTFDGGEELVLGPDELVRVPPDVRRQLTNFGPGRLLLLALGGAGEHQSRDAEAFTAWDSAEPGPPQEVPLPVDLPPGELRS